MLTTIKQRAASHCRLLTYSSKRLSSTENDPESKTPNMDLLWKWDASELADLPAKIRHWANATPDDRIEENAHKKWKQLQKDQEFRSERFDKLGADLAAATFIVHRGGKVKFEHIPRWTKIDSGKRDSVPIRRNDKYKLEGIDCSDMELLSVGLDNLIQLEHLRYLKLSSMKVLIDDWFLARLARFSDTLEFLDISKNSLVTEEGLISLYKLRNLKCVDITGCTNIHNIEVVSTYLAETNPDLTIIGINTLPKLQNSLQEREQKLRRFLNLGEPYVLETKTDAKDSVIKNTDTEGLSEKDKETRTETFNENKKAAQTAAMS